MGASPRPRALRLAHTSDWHLGIELGTESRRPDHVRAIDSVIEHCKEFAPDAIVHTGDLFDHARPGGEDQALAADALRRLSEIAPTVVIGGNHDNKLMLDQAWGPLANLAGDGRLTIRGRLHHPEAGGVVSVHETGGDRRILVCTVPFVTAHSFARFDRPGETTRGFTAGIQRLHEAYTEWLKKNSDPATDKVIWAAHLLVSGAQPAGSERKIDLGADYATTASQIPAVSYAAFGHIHRAQEIPGAVDGRYAGGMLHFRFHEAQEGEPEKGIVLVELPANGAPKMTVAPIDTGRRLVELSARLDELPSHAKEVDGCFVRVIALLDGPVPGLRSRIADALPGAILVEVRQQIEGDLAAPGAPRRESTGLDEMLERWLTDNPVAGADPERAVKTVQTMVAAAVAGTRIPLDDEQLLDPDVATELVRELGETTGWVDPEAEELAADVLASAVVATSGNGTEDAESKGDDG
jgi:DNA repair protein SbcD/Mre11